ncbi:MAG: 3'-5' exonuclease, partial [Myxococcota bacterium]|nr:3'-5' exonuclease [Myxococcota bacterium]
VQYRLICLLADHGERNIVVVGDEDQSIYSFRGADIRNILDFERDFEGAAVVRLERNYRSTETILKAAGAVVEANTERLGKTLWTDAGSGELIDLKVAFDERDEARSVLEFVGRERRSGRRAGDIAVFYRANSQSRVLEEEFIASRVPFVLLGGQRFYERKEVKDVLAYLKLLLNPHDDVALLRTLNTPPRGIGQGTRQKVIERAGRNGTCCWAGLTALVDQGEVGTRARKCLTSFRQLIEQLRVAARQSPVEELLDQVYRLTGLWERLESEGTFESQGRLENLAELRNSTAPYNDLAPPTGLVEFLDRVSLIADTDSLGEGDGEEEGRVTLMTIHAAKGLEFPVVLVVGMDEEVFPHARASLFDKDLQEERRLAYVAITRAREKLYLLRARRRMRSGSYQDVAESRFLRQIPRAFLRGDLRMSGARAAIRQPAAFSPDETHVVYDEARPTSGGAWRSRFGSSAGQSGASVPAPHARRGRKVARRGESPDSPPPPREQGDDEERVVLEGEAAGMLAVGTRVLHPQFGEGEVRSLDGSPDNLRATVFFRSGGTKRLFVRYAQLEVLSR